jgi:hypothetical protein
MHIHHFSATSASALSFHMTPSAPICILRGKYSDLILDLLRETIGDYGAEKDPDRIDDGRFVLHADVEMDGKTYAVCYLRNADTMGDHRIAVNFTQNSLSFSLDDTKEFDRKRRERNSDDRNVFFVHDLPTNASLSESDRNLHAFSRFLKKTADDDRPLFIYSFFDRIDDAIDPHTYLRQLAALGRQVFVAVCEGYPTEKLQIGGVYFAETEAEA